MNPRVTEALRGPALNSIRIGALALIASASLYPGHIDDELYQANHPVTPRVSSIERVREAGMTEKSAMATTSSATELDNTGVNYEPAPPATNAAGQSQEQQLEAGIPTIVQQYIDRNTVQLLLGEILCSGSLIRNTEGVPVGALTAAHCVDSTEARTSNPLVRGADGNTYMVTSELPILEIGADTNDLQEVGKVAEFVVPPIRTNLDQAFAVLPGHTAQEVLTDYSRRELPPKRAEQLVDNRRTIWLSGYPIIQNGDDTGAMIRQEFPTRYVGAEYITTTFGTVERVLTSTMTIDSNGAVCSWGMSGGEGIIIKNADSSDGKAKQVIRSVGDVSGFSSFREIKQDSGWIAYSKTAAQLARLFFHLDFPWADYKHADASCSYAIMPIKRKSRLLIYPVNSADAVPAPTTKVK